jgi:mRNA-degrading endonuclease RelE of RelBE toxin-antitoxin system
MYRLKISAQAKRNLKNLKKLYEEEVGAALEELKRDPFLGKDLVDELQGRYSYRIDVYRIIYIVKVKDKVVYILSAGHRSIVYN